MPLSICPSKIKNRAVSRMNKNVKTDAIKHVPEEHASKYLQLPAERDLRVYSAHKTPIISPKT